MIGLSAELDICLLAAILEYDLFTTVMKTT